MQDKTATIAIIGAGYVGLPLILCYAKAGFQVIAIDNDADKIAQLQSGETYIAHISKSTLLLPNIQFTTDMTVVAEASAMILCLPTPLNEYREPELGFLIGAVDALLPHLVKGQVISIESTTYPGTTAEEIQPRIESKGFSIGQDIFLVYSPEREDPGNHAFSTMSTPKICSGCTAECLAIGIALYQQIVEQVVPVSSTQVAEMTKLLENIHRAVNIGLVNELKMVTDKMGIDIFEVIDAAATKPFGFVPYYPGPGIGGHCIPIDPFYLTWKARSYGLHTHFIELAGEINSNMPKWVLEKIIQALNERGLPLSNSKILVLGIAYKRNVEDVRESPSVALLKLLQDRGADVDYSDPYVPMFPKMRNYHFDLKSIPLTQESIKQYDAVILATAHELFDFKFIRKHAKLIIDTRGVYRKMASNVVAA